MDNQAEEVNPQIGHGKRERVSKNLKGLIRDGAKLLDLQIQLLLVDLRDFWTKARFGLAGIIIASAGLLSTFPILLMGLAFLVESQFDLSRSVAFLSVSVVSIIVAGAILFWGGLRLKYAASKLSRSSDELSKNLTWLRSLFSDE